MAIYFLSSVGMLWPIVALWFLPSALPQSLWLYQVSVLGTSNCRECILGLRNTQVTLQGLPFSHVCTHSIIYNVLFWLLHFIMLTESIGQEFRQSSVGIAFLAPWYLGPALGTPRGGRWLDHRGIESSGSVFSHMCNGWYSTDKVPADNQYFDRYLIWPLLAASG